MHTRRLEELALRWQTSWNVPFCYVVCRELWKPIWVWVWRKPQHTLSSERRSWDGTVLIRNGPIWFQQQMSLQMWNPWKSTESKGKEKAMTKAKVRMTKEIRKESQSRKVKAKARPRTTMTKAVNLERESQSKIQGKAKEKVNEFAMSATSLATWPKTAGTMWGMYKRLHQLGIRVSLDGQISQVYPNRELAINQFSIVLNKVNSSNQCSRQLSFEFHESPKQWRRIHLCVIYVTVHCQAPSRFQVLWEPCSSTLGMTQKIICKRERSEQSLVNYLQMLVKCVTSC